MVSLVAADFVQSKVVGGAQGTSSQFLSKLLRSTDKHSAAPLSTKRGGHEGLLTEASEAR